MTRHPAKFTDALIPIIARELDGCANVIDPFAGTGKLADIEAHGYDGTIYLNELEPEWAELCREYKNTVCTISDAISLPYQSDFFDAVATSPSYGNRMADSFKPSEGWNSAKRERNTYTHALGRRLTRNNSGAMQWGAAYRHFHRRAWMEVQRILKQNGIFVLNVKDHIRNGKQIEVTDWHISTLLDLGFQLDNLEEVHTPGQRYGANAKLRLDYESVITFINRG